MPPPKDGLPRRRPRLCKVCKHPERDRIEMLLAAGLSLDRVAEKFDGIDRDALWRHWTRHVPEERKRHYLAGPAKLAELTEIATEESGSVLDHLRVMRSVLMSALSNSAEARDYQTLTGVSRPLLGVLKQIAEISGEISRISNVTLNVSNNSTAIFQSPAFLELEAGLLRLCAKHPRARGDVVELLQTLDRKFAPAPAAPTGQLIEAHANG
jgi:hypothetical protein